MIERWSAETSAEVIRLRPRVLAARELGVEPEPPGVVHVAGIVGLPIRPHQVGSQMECPGGGIGADATILHGRHLGCCPGMNHALRIPVEEGQVQRLVDLTIEKADREYHWE